MKYLLIFGLLFSGVYAHSGDVSHIHFFSSWHVEEFVLLLVAIVAGVVTFKYFTKEPN